MPRGIDPDCPFALAKTVALYTHLFGLEVIQHLGGSAIDTARVDLVPDSGSTIQATSRFGS